MSGTIVDELGRIPMSPNLAAALHRASSYAQAQAHREVTLEHLLLALTEDPDAGQVLEASRIDLHRLHGDVSSHIGRIEDRNPPDLTGHISVSAELRRILEAAAAAALKGRRREINGAIVLAAIVGDGRTIAAHMLRAQGLTFEEAIRVLQRAPAPQPAPKVPGPPPPPSPSMRQAPPPAPPEPPTPPPQAHAPPPQAHMHAPGQQRPSAEDVITSARERVQRNWVEPAPPRRPEPEFDQQPSFDEPEAALPPPQPSQGFEPRFEPAFPPPPDARPLEMEPEPAEALVQGLEPQHPYGFAPPPPPSAPVSAPGEFASPPPPPPPAPQHAGVGEPAFEASQLHQPAAAPPAPPPPPQRFPTSWAPPPQPPPHPPAAPALRPNRPPPPLPPAIPDMPVPPDPRMLDPRLAGWPPHAPPHGPSPQIGSQMAPQMAPPPRDPQGAGFAVPPPGFGPRDSGPPPPQPPPAPWQEPARRAEPQFEPPPPPPEDDFDPEVPPSRGGPAQRAEPRFEQPKRVGAIELGQLIENIGAKMRVGVPQTVEVRIAKADVRAFAEATGQELLVTKAVAMRLRATDHGFFVETAAPETQWIENTAGGMMSDDYASWRWTVTPRKRGKRRRLLLVVAARAVGGDGAAAEAALPERVYEVRVRGNVGQMIKRWIGWGLAAVVGGLLVKFGDQIVPAAMKLVQALMAGPQP